MRLGLSSYGASVGGGSAPEPSEDPIVIGQAVAVRAAGDTSGLLAPQLRIEVGAAAITLGGTPEALGTSPPAVTFTGTLAFAAGTCPNIYVEIDSVAGGTARGQATFRVSYNGGGPGAIRGAGTGTWAQSGVPTAATVALDGAASGVTLNFPTGTYGTTQSWEGRVATIRSTEGNTYTFTQATTTAQPVFRKAAVTPDGKDALFFATSTRWVASTDAAVLALFTNDPALTVISRLDYTTVDATGTWLCASTSTDPTNTKRRWQQLNTGAGREAHAGTNDAGATFVNTCSVDPSMPAAAHNVCWYFPGSNGGANLTVDDASRALTSSASDIGTFTPTRVAIGAEADSTPASGFAGYLYDLAVWNSVLNAGSRTAWHAEMAA